MNIDIIADFLNLLKGENIPVPTIYKGSTYIGFLWSKDNEVYSVNIERANDKYFWSLVATDGLCFSEGLEGYKDIAEKFLEVWK